MVNIRRTLLLSGLACFGDRGGEIGAATAAPLTRTNTAIIVGRIADISGKERGDVGARKV